MEAKGGEVRRIHIIYFLSRMGIIEHPHLIRVHHLNRNGVYLRDVKRWLADLRGKDMPEAFAWSYKRRYKTGYVWQDLLDDDLITPISDNEYVIKGSEIIPTTPSGPCSIGENKISNLEQQPVEDKHQQPSASPKEAIQTYPDPKMNTPSKISSEINEESPLFGSERSTLTEDSMKLEAEKLLERNKQDSAHDQQSERFEISSSFYSNLLNKKKKKKKNKNSKEEKTSLFSPSQSPFTKSKSYSSGASHMFRNLMTCGAVNTNDAVLVMINRTDKSSSNKFTDKPENKAEIGKGEKLEGSARVLGTSQSQHQQQQQQQQHSARKISDGAEGSKKKKMQREFTNKKTVSAAYKPVGGPNCSQCGKQFKPEKMHRHMKSCRGMKALAKTPAAIHRSMNSSNNEPAPAYFLTN